MSDEDFEVAKLEAKEVVEEVLRSTAGEPVEVVAADVVEELVHVRADLVQRLAYPSAKRWWYCRRAALHMELVPWFGRGCDEFGNDTVTVRVPFGGQLVVATTRPLRRIVEPAGGRIPARTDLCSCSGTENPPLPSEMDPSCRVHGAW